MPTSDDDHRAKTLTMRLEARWSFVDDIRRLVHTFCAEAADEERGAEVALAAHEMVQNAIANASSPDIELELAVDPAARGVQLAVSHGCAPEKVERLRARLARLYAYADALQGYLATMAENPDGQGGLGLARIRYESNLDLAVEERPGRLTVRAYRN
jgi:anti-sigma regulatory factor (Ser/Thr protein kinase)